VIPIILVIGYVFDLIGRRLTLIMALVPSGILVMYMPDVSPSLNQLTLLRSVISIALATLASHPFINDFVCKETRGRAIAIQSIGVVIGDLLTFLIMLNLTRGMTQYGRFRTFGFSIIAIAALFFLLVKEPRYKEKRKAKGYESFENKSMKQ
jgi:MFS family permease